MTESKKPQMQITVKRNVAVRAVVTEQFKDFLKLELKENVRMAKLRIEEIDKQMMQGDKVSTLIPQLLSERQQLQFTLEHEDQQRVGIEQLENGSLFNQGSVEGFVTVSEGDNLYEKIGGMEVIVKDGVIQKITSLAIPTSIPS